MARFIIKDYESLGCKGYHNASSWEVALDKDFKNIIDSTYKNKDAIREWRTPLPNGKGGFYKTLDKIYARCKVWIDDDSSEWFEVKPANQNDQLIRITEEGKPDRYVSKIEAGIKN